MPENQFPIGQRINLPGHFPEPVVLEAVRAIGDGFECRVRLADGTPDETILSREEADTLLGQRADTPISVHQLTPRSSSCSSNPRVFVLPTPTTSTLP